MMRTELYVRLNLHLVGANAINFRPGAHRAAEKGGGGAADPGPVVNHAWFMGPGQMVSCCFVLIICSGGSRGCLESDFGLPPPPPPLEPEYECS